jgi:cellular nucleic acid-binding protein
MAKPCPLCAQTNHTIRTCPVKSVCYNCGIPGHVSRDCMQQRNLPPRRICTICYQTDHTKEVCHNGFTAAQSYNAECMVCYERGHHLCKEMKWARGHQLQQGVSCYNCGQSNHVGSVCSQPKLDDCSRDEALAIHLVETATKFYEDERCRARAGAGGSNGGRHRGGGRASLDGGDGDRYPPAARGRQANQDFEFDRRRNRSVPPMRNAPFQQKQPPGGGGGGNDPRRHRGR